MATKAEDIVAAAIDAGNAAAAIKALRAIIDAKHLAASDRVAAARLMLEYLGKV